MNDHMTHVVIWNSKQFCDRVQPHRIFLSGESLVGKTNFIRTG